jgi:hypothetical protein
MSPRAKRTKTSKAGANGKANGKNAGNNNSGEGLLVDPYQASADMIARLDTSTGEGVLPGKQTVLSTATNAGMSQIINHQMLLPRSMLAGVINENVVKHLSTLLCMVAQEKEDKLKKQQSSSGGGDATATAANEQPELSDTLTDTEKDVSTQEEDQVQTDHHQNEHGDNTQLEKTLLCEEEPQGLFELDSPKHGYPNLSKNSLQAASVSARSKQQADTQNMSNKETAMAIDSKTGAAAANASAHEQDTMALNNNSQNNGTRGRGGNGNANAQVGSVPKGQGAGTPHQSASNSVSQVYVEQERAILQELNNCLQVVSQMGRQQAEYVRFILSPVVPAVQHMLNTPTSTGANNTATATAPQPTAAAAAAATAANTLQQTHAEES